jgi:hypothetical protein
MTERIQAEAEKIHAEIEKHEAVIQAALEMRHVAPHKKVHPRRRSSGKKTKAGV